MCVWARREPFIIMRMFGSVYGNPSLFVFYYANRDIFINYMTNFQWYLLFHGLIICILNLLFIVYPIVFTLSLHALDTHEYETTQNAERKYIFVRLYVECFSLTERFHWRLFGWAVTSLLRFTLLHFESFFDVWFNWPSCLKHQKNPLICSRSTAYHTVLKHSFIGKGRRRYSGMIKTNWWSQ